MSKSVVAGVPLSGSIRVPFGVPEDFCNMGLGFGL